MRERPSVLLLTCCGLATVLLLSGTGRAQMAGFRDLTSGWRPPADHISVPDSCSNPKSSLAGGERAPSDASKKTENVQLTIASTNPAALEIGKDFTANVRLKNSGTKPLLIPQIPDGEKTVRTSGDRTEEEYEVGDITFRLATDPKHAMAVILTSGGALFANPDDPASYISLQPGTWLELKLSGTVECGVSQCFGGINPDKKAVLTAWWYQRVLTHKVDGCEEIHGSRIVRDIDSTPFPIEVVNPSVKESAIALKF